MFFFLNESQQLKIYLFSDIVRQLLKSLEIFPTEFKGAQNNTRQLLNTFVTCGKHSHNPHFHMMPWLHEL